MTGINVPDMPKIVYEMGLTPVPVDIDFSTTSPVMESLVSLISPNVSY
jgi:hypothetical protein